MICYASGGLNQWLGRHCGMRPFELTPTRRCVTPSCIRSEHGVQRPRQFPRGELHLIDAVRTALDGGAELGIAAGAFRQREGELLLLGPGAGAVPPEEIDGPGIGVRLLGPDGAAMARASSANARAVFNWDALPEQ